MKKILFFSFLLISSIILVASCESGPSKSVDTRIGPNGCSCTIWLTARDQISGIGNSTTEVQEYSRAQLEGWYTDCTQLQPFLEERYKDFYVGGVKVTYVEAACLPK